MKARLVTFTQEYPETAEDFFQAEVRSTREEMENLIGFSLKDVSGESENIELMFKGCALLDGLRPVPCVIHNWVPNRRDWQPEYVWHIRTTFYQDGCIIRDFMNSVLHPSEQ